MRQMHLTLLIEPNARRTGTLSERGKGGEGGGRSTTTEASQDAFSLLSAQCFEVLATQGVEICAYTSK